MSVPFTANGQPSTTPEGTTVQRFVEGLGLQPLAVLVERNGEILLRELWPTTPIAAGDRLEIFRVSAGG